MTEGVGKIDIMDNEITPMKIIIHIYNSCNVSTFKVEQIQNNTMKINYITELYSNLWYKFYIFSFIPGNFVCNCITNIIKSIYIYTYIQPDNHNSSTFYKKTIFAFATSCHCHR